MLIAPAPAQTFEFAGKLVAWDVFTGRLGTTKAIVWRPTGQPDSYSVVCAQEIDATQVCHGRPRHSRPRTGYKYTMRLEFLGPLSLI